MRMSFKYENQEELGQQLVPLLVDENAQKVLLFLLKKKRFPFRPSTPFLPADLVIGSFSVKISSRERGDVYTCN